AAKGTNTRVTCTRKTTPGLRIVEKLAVLHGGGSNHRYSLSDAILIKDNHIAACGGSVETALARAAAYAGHLRMIELEVDTLEQLDVALASPHRPHAVLLDNMAPGTLEAAVKRIGGACLAEASGGVTLDTVRDIAETGVDYISVGALTHSAPNLDVGLDVA
ncbi:MAG: nicotinate-nucleotide diphosphorylase (carboxylating), partial [Pseudomonadota bacterium]